MFDCVLSIITYLISVQQQQQQQQNMEGNQVNGTLLVSFLLVFVGAGFFAATMTPASLTIITNGKNGSTIPSLDPEVLLNHAFVAESHSEAGYQILYIDMKNMVRHWAEMDEEGNFLSGSLRMKMPGTNNLQSSLVYTLTDKENYDYFCKKRMEPLKADFIASSFVDTFSVETGVLDIEMGAEKSKNPSYTLEYLGQVELLLPPDYYTDSSVVAVDEEKEDSNVMRNDIVQVNQFLFRYEKNGNLYTSEYSDRVDNRMPVLFTDAQDQEWWIKPADISDVSHVLSDFPPRWCMTKDSYLVEIEPLGKAASGSECVGWVSTSHCSSEGSPLRNESCYYLPKNGEPGFCMCKDGSKRKEMNYAGHFSCEPAKTFQAFNCDTACKDKPQRALLSDRKLSTCHRCRGRKKRFRKKSKGKGGRRMLQGAESNENIGRELAKFNHCKGANLATCSLLSENDPEAKDAKIEALENVKWKSKCEQEIGAYCSTSKGKNDNTCVCAKRCDFAGGRRALSKRVTEEGSRFLTSTRQCTNRPGYGTTSSCVCASSFVKKNLRCGSRPCWRCEKQCTERQGYGTTTACYCVSGWQKRKLNCGGKDCWRCEPPTKSPVRSPAEAVTECSMTAKNWCDPINPSSGCACQPTNSQIRTSHGGVAVTCFNGEWKEFMKDQVCDSNSDIYKSEFITRDYYYACSGGRLRAVGCFDITGIEYHLRPGQSFDYLPIKCQNDRWSSNDCLYTCSFDRAKFASVIFVDRDWEEECERDKQRFGHYVEKDCKVYDEIYKATGMECTVCYC